MVLLRERGRGCGCDCPRMGTNLRLPSRPTNPVATSPLDDRVLPDRPSRLVRSRCDDLASSSSCSTRAPTSAVWGGGAVAFAFLDRSRAGGRARVDRPVPPRRGGSYATPTENPLAGEASAPSGGAASNPRTPRWFVRASNHLPVGLAVWGGTGARAGARRPRSARLARDRARFPALLGRCRPDALVRKRLAGRPATAHGSPGVSRACARCR